jgi:hypothetical protein
MDDKLHQALLDPKWKTGLCEFDGHRLVFLLIEHPEHGDIACLLPKAEAAKLVVAMADLLKAEVGNVKANTGVVGDAIGRH